MISPGGGGADCAVVRARLGAFLANEIEGDGAAEVRSHLEACGGCRRYRDFEVAFDGALARGLSREAVEPSLPDRIREALRREDAAADSASRGRGSAVLKVLTAAAATIVVAVLGYGVAHRSAPPAPAAPSRGPAIEQVRTGILVCAACERGGAPATKQRGCRAFGHHAAFRGDSDGLWEFVESDTTMPLLTDADRIGRAIEVRGLFFEELHYVRVSSYRYLPEPAPAEGKGSGL